jgi:hypothetical protein
MFLKEKVTASKNESGDVAAIFSKPFSAAQSKCPPARS